MVMMKRSREEMENNIALDMAKYLILLSSSNGGGETEEKKFIKNESLSSIKGDSNRVFECKTCNRKFQSFQALGGHRASHKKPRMIDSSDDHQKTQLMKPKSHECSICGSEFSIGQALGGHMRRHRAAIVHEISSKSMNLSTPSHQEQVAVSILRRSNSSRRVLCLDLNLSPPGSVDYEFSGIPNTGISSSSPRKSTSKPMINFFI